MRHLAHLITADVRRSWLPLSAWLVLAVVTAIIPCGIPLIAGRDLRLMSSLEFPVAIVVVAYPLVLLVLVIQVVQTHPLVGSSAFWMTRPIPPQTLFASKVVLLGLAAVVVPMVIEVVRMTAHGVPWSTQLGVAIDTALAHALLLMVLMLGAAVTRSFSRFMLLVGVLLASLAALAAVLILIGRQSSSPPSYMGWSVVRDPTPGMVQLGLLIGAAAAALAVQYGLRSRARTAAVAIAGIVVAVAVSSVWPWSWLRSGEHPPAWAQRDAALPVSVQEPNALRSFAFAGLGEENWIGVRGPLSVGGIDPGFTVRVGVAEASLQLGGVTLTSHRELSYFLRNRRQREAVQGFGRPLGEAMSSFGNFSFNFGVDHREDGFRARELLLQFSPGNRDEQTIVIDEAWLAEAELVIVATRRSGMVERDLAIANFPITLPIRAGF